MFLSDSLFSNSSNIRNEYPIKFCRFSFSFGEGFSIYFPYKEECQELFKKEPQIFQNNQESFLNLISSEFLSSFIFTLNKAKALQIPWEWTGTFQIEDKISDLLFKANPNLNQENGHWEGIIIDISHLKTKNAPVPKLDEIPRDEFGKLAHTGTWSMKLEPFQIRWDDETRRIHNLSNISLINFNQVIELYPKEYRATLRKAIKSAILTKETFDLEIPYSAAGSNWKWIRICGKPLEEKGPVTEIFGIVQDVTQTKEMEEKIRQNQRYLMDNHFMNNGSWVTDLRNGINIWSTQALKLFEFDPDIQGPSNKEFESRIHPEDYEYYKKAIIEGLKDKKSIGFNFRIILPNGKIKQVSTVARAIFGNNNRAIKLCGYLKEGLFDPNELIQANESTDEFQSFVKSCPMALAVLDKNLNFIRVSDRWIEEYELQSTKILGKSLCEVSASIHEKLSPILKKGIEEGKSIQDHNEEFLLINERWEWVRWEVQSWFERNSTIGGYILKTEFITQRKQEEFELIRAKEAAEKATLAKSQFLSTISHEIRTPLNAVIGFTNLLLQEDPLPHQQEYLNILKFSSENLSNLLNDILDFSKIETEKVKLEEVEFNPRELLSKIRLSFLSKAKEKNLAFRIMMDEDVPKILLGDPERLKQILSNLVGNAIKFTMEGKVVINLSLSHKDTDHSTLLFEVLDTGIGIEKEKQKVIFEGFTQSFSSHENHFGGTGLGLSITQKLTQLFGGEVWVESEPGKGSTFFLKLKFKNYRQELTDDNPAKIDGSSLKGVKILVVEDNPINALLTKVILRQWDVDCEFAENGKIGLDMVQHKDYDLVFMDLQMPIMDGYEATKEIRKLDNEKFKILPIVALTASVLEDSRERALQAGLDDFLMKPVSHSDMFHTIKKFLDKKNSWENTSLIRSISGRMISPRASNG